MTKQELVAYLGGLLQIMDSKDAAGVHRGYTIIDEYQKHYDLLREQLGKEREDEARKSKLQRPAGEAGADLSRSEPSRSGPAWAGNQRP